MTSKTIWLIAVINKEDENTAFLGVNEYLGIGYIKEVLCKNGYDARIQIAQYDNDYDFRQTISEMPMIIGFNMYSDTYNQVFHLAAQAKMVYPKAYVIIGGPQVNGYEVEILNDHPEVDFIISYEGEYTFLALADRLRENKSVENCEGLTFRSVNGQIVKNKPRKAIENLDALPFPSREIHEKYRQQYLYISGSRGCNGGCIFCGETMARKNAPNVRLRSAKSIVDEIEFLYKKYNMTSFRMTDSTFEDPGERGFKRANEIFDEIISRRLDIGLHLFSRADLVVSEPDAYFNKAYEAGVECFYIGIESGDSGDLHLYKKKSNTDINMQAINKIRAANIHLGMGFICFNPFSTYESLRNNNNFMHESGLGHNFYLLQTRLEVLPQAPIRKKLIEQGLMIGDAGYCTHFYDYHFSDPLVEKFYHIIKRAYTEQPVYYMDTILGMNRVWIKRCLTEEKRLKFDDMYAKFDSLCQEYAEKNFRFFSQCLDLCFHKASDEQIDNLIREYNLNELYQLYLAQYNKINIRVTKERVMYHLK